MRRALTRERVTAVSFAAVSVAVVLTPAIAAGQALDTFGFGARSASLGGAVTADVSDAGANYYNPAGIVRTDGMNLSLGYFYASPSLYQNDVDSQVDEIRGTVLGVNVPGRFGDFRFAFGVGVHLPDTRVSRTRSLPRQQPRWEFYDNRPHRTYLAANVAVRPVDWLMIGGGIGFLAFSENRLKIRGGIDLGSPSGASRLEHEIEFGLQTIRFPQVGVQVVVPGCDCLSVGLTYRGEFALDNTLSAEADAFITGLDDPIPAYLFLETVSVNAFVPQQVAFGVSFTPHERVKVNADLTWVDWSSYVSAIGASDVILDIDVPPSLTDLINVPDSIASTRGIPAGFEDRIVPRFGVEAAPVLTDDFELWGRAGYFYENSPVPEQTGLTNLLDGDRHTFSLGVGVRIGGLEPTLPGTLGFDAYFAASLIGEEVTRKASLVDAIGDYHTDGSILMGGASIEVAFE